MSPALCSVHTHSTLCDGKSTPAEMARAAFAAGVRVLGFSGHSHTPIPEDGGCVLPADMGVYRETVLALREEYRGRMEILLGLEWDSRSDVSPAGFDYWIGSVHHLPAGNGTCPVDWSPERFAAGRDACFGGDALALVRAYYREAAAVAEKRPTILGHLDLVTKFNAGGRFFDEDAPAYRAAALEALHAADLAATLLEVNTGAMARGWRDEPYPALFLLREWRAMGGGIILSDDAHSADTLCFGFGRAADWARAAGFERSVCLTEKGKREVSL